MIYFPESDWYIFYRTKTKCNSIFICRCLTLEGFGDRIVFVWAIFCRLINSPSNIWRACNNHGNKYNQIVKLTFISMSYLVVIFICLKPCFVDEIYSFNPLSPHDALKHHFTSLKTHFIFLLLVVFEWKFPWNWFTNTWQFSSIFHTLQVIFIHYKSRIAIAIRGL